MNKIYSPLRLLIILILTSSCSQDLFISKSYSTAFSNITASFFEKDSFITQELVNSIPYASSSISFQGKESLIILESFSDEENIWVSSDNKLFFTKAGRVISTIGLPTDLYRIESPEISFEKIKEIGSLEYISYYSFRKPKLDNLKVKVNSKLVGLQPVQILDKTLKLLLIEETLFSEKINWRVKNNYWIDPETNYLWASEQNISPKLPVLTMKITKKPAL